MREPDKCFRCNGAQLQLGRESEPSLVFWAKHETTTGFGVLSWCAACNKAATMRFVPKASFTEQELSEMPFVRAGEMKNPCAVCGEMALLETHHLAPREMFGDESEKWPTVRVCRRCHERWHNTVNMYRAEAAQ